MNTIHIEIDGFNLTFNNVIDAFIFDEKNSNKDTFHGVAMKCVDVIVEDDKYNYFIELKNFYSTEQYTKRGSKNDAYKTLKNILKYKFRDTFLYRYAENKIKKPIKYICILIPDKYLNLKIFQDLQRELPVGLASPRWSRELASSCFVGTIEQCNAFFPQWKIELCNTETSDGSSLS